MTLLHDLTLLATSHALKLNTEIPSGKLKGNTDK